MSFQDAMDKPKHQLQREHRGAESNEGHWVDQGHVVQRP